MTVTGIIAEFNPFHNGHKYLLDQAEGVKIVAMSGNFVQRGEPAIVDKWTRAQMALENGADLVLSCLSLRQFSLLIILLLEPSKSCPDWELIALLLARKKS